MKKHKDYERIVMRIPPAMKRRLLEKLDGRTMTFIGKKLIAAYLEGELDLGDSSKRTDHDARPVRQRA